MPPHGLAESGHGMSSVTSCSVCDGPLEGKYANALTCSSRCRQKRWRLRAKGEVPRRCNGSAKASWKALRAELELTDDELRASVLALAAEAGFGSVDARTLTDRAARARIAQPRVSAEDRQLFTEAERAKAEWAAAS
jgi:hypothetical protein